MSSQDDTTRTSTDAPGRRPRPVSGPVSAPRPAVLDPAAPHPSRPAPSATGPAGRRAALVPALALASVVLLVATVLFGVLWVHERSKASDAAELAAYRSQALTTAQKTAIDFSSYDYRRLDANFATVSAQLSGSFQTDYRSTATSLKPTLVKYQGIATAKVLDAGVATVSRSKATVIVFLDQTVTSSVSRTPTVDRNRVEVQLVRSGQRWLVSALNLK